MRWFRQRMFVGAMVAALVKTMMGSPVYQLRKMMDRQSLKVGAELFGAKEILLASPYLVRTSFCVENMTPKVYSIPQVAGVLIVTSLSVKTLTFCRRMLMPKNVGAATINLPMSSLCSAIIASANLACDNYFKLMGDFQTADIAVGRRYLQHGLTQELRSVVVAVIVLLCRRIADLRVAANVIFALRDVTDAFRKSAFAWLLVLRLAIHRSLGILFLYSW